MKLHRGKRYSVSCRQLDTPPTKDASWRQANQWWEQKVAGLHAEAEAAHPYRAQLDLLARRREWALRQSRTDLADSLSAQIENLQNTSDDDAFPYLDESVSQNIAIAETFGIVVPPDLDPEVAAHYFGDRRLWQEPLQQRNNEPTEPDHTIGGQVARWVKIQRGLAEVGKITPDRADNNRSALNHFKDFVRAASPVATINSATLEAFFLFCHKQVNNRALDAAKKAGWSSEYAKKVFGIARTFVRYLWEENLIELPRNIASRRHRFRGAAKKIRTFTISEFNNLYGAATGQLRLHLLLMANCGMLQTDISDLKQNEVDWKRGRIIRKRSKTKTEEDVPEVNYKLWPITFQLLKNYRSTNSEHVLFTEAGNRWVTKSIVNGKLRKSDNVASCYAHLKRKTRIDKPLKLVRKTSASIIEEHREYGRYKSHFLGHSPRSTADRHYAAPSTDLFDEIVDWLGEKYGLTSTTKAVPKQPDAKAS